MKTILTKKRIKVIKEVKKTGRMSCWQEFSLIPTIYEDILKNRELKEIRI